MGAGGGEWGAWRRPWKPDREREVLQIICANLAAQMSASNLGSRVPQHLIFLLAEALRQGWPLDRLNYIRRIETSILYGRDTVLGADDTKVSKTQSLSWRYS